MLYFFLSYAREDDPTHIRRFFDDLCGHVRDLAGADRNERVGFLDEHSIQLGQRWATELSDALSTCRCFVALTSPRYFRRDYCGREWFVFHDRLQMYEQRWKRPAPALLPVQWIPTNPAHPLAAEIQKPGWALAGMSYREYGLRQLLDLKRFRDDYRTFIFGLARQIVETARAHTVPPPRRQIVLRQVPNIFDTQTGDVAAPSGGQQPPERGRRSTSRRYVHFVIVAGSRDEMSSRRRKLEYYGRERIDWAPYWPVLDGPVGGYATRIADGRLFDCEVGDIAGLGQRMEDAKRKNEVVVLLVDAWSLDFVEHQRALAEFDSQDDPTSAVMIPFSSGDSETISDTTVLQARLANALPRSLGRRDRVMLRQNVPTHDHFGASLEEILEVAQNRIFKKGTVNPRVPRRPPRPRPILEGPASSADGANE